MILDQSAALAAHARSQIVGTRYNLLDREPAEPIDDVEPQLEAAVETAAAIGQQSQDITPRERLRPGSRRARIVEVLEASTVPLTSTQIVERLRLPRLQVDGRDKATARISKVCCDLVLAGLVVRDGSVKRPGFRRTETLWTVPGREAAAAEPSAQAQPIAWPRGDSQAARIVEFLTRHGEATTPEIADAIGAADSSNVCNLLRKLEHALVVRCIPRPSGASTRIPHRWHLIDDLVPQPLPPAAETPAPAPAVDASPGPRAPDREPAAERRRRAGPPDAARTDHRPAGARGSRVPAELSADVRGQR